MGTSTIRVGWIARIRLPGISTDDAKPILPAGVPLFETSDHPLNVEVSLLLTDPAVFEPPARHIELVAGHGTGQPVRSANIRTDDVSGAWLRVVVSREFEVDRKLHQTFQRTNDPSPLHGAMREEVEARLKAHGLVLAWCACARFADSYPQMRQTDYAYWTDSTNYRVRHDYRLHFQVASPSTVGATDFAAHVQVVASHGALTIGKDRRKHMAVACDWLLQSADLPLGSSSRFLAYFMAIEALCKVLPCDNAARQAAYGAMHAALTEAARTGQSAAEQALEILARIRGIVSDAPLKDRFAALAQALQLPSRDRDLDEFATLADLRHKLLHASTADAPPTVGELDVEMCMRRLACDYTNGLITYLARTKLQTG